MFLGEICALQSTLLLSRCRFVTAGLTNCFRELKINRAEDEVWNMTVFERTAAGASHGTEEWPEKTARSPLPRNIFVSVSKVHVFDKDLEEK